jgi:AraC family transcriptional regulator
MDTHSQKADAPEFPLGETHGIALWPKHRLLVDSRGMGWRDAYTSLAVEDSWRRTLNAVPHICLAYCQHGAASVSRGIDGERVAATAELRSRLFGVVPEGVESDWNLRGRPSIQLIYLRRSMVETVAEEVFDLEGARLAVTPRLGFADPMLEQLTLELLDCARDGGPGGLYPDHLARMIAMRVTRRHIGQNVRAPGRFAQADSADLTPRLRRVRDLIESEPGQELSLERLAREAGIGAHALSAAFARAFGMPPHRYVLERRIEWAKTLLLARELPLADIALQCGFASQSHLTTTFRRIVGCTPGAFRTG